MQEKVLNYRVIIESEKMGKKTVYNAYCPTLGVADYGDSIDEVLKSIKDGIELALGYLKDEGKEIPVDSPNAMVATTEVKAPVGSKIVAA
ncbi:hypothetical protein A2696_03460 [Candidatus Curtissbacteria bacterium RIFCSPHIGHO2_01_FULL_41_13]|uniref:HicB-like antitoxin of toxin-antitoxin system domain-containing protein n=1 Tax=Candidatus Curtissbacteria bacterium RIFCSPHIGHO2_01_FULL_41_13 TaxID=1797745 RepID=A0A1F5G226_9BACT|nr:MAG: hypothetical protein A2696_03460 [Candidatus Curtissbacteria bacterium RIFCSPHIGHO2_01_FULL_41_13]